LERNEEIEMKTMALTLAVVLGTSAYADDAGESRSSGGEVDVTMKNAEEDSRGVRHELRLAQADLESADTDLEGVSEEMYSAVEAWTRAIDRLWEGQYAATRPFLGVLIADQSEEGITVGGVTPEGGAEAAGLQAMDVIVGINDEALTGHRRPLRTLHKVLDGFAPGDPVTVVVKRDGDEHSFEVVTTAFADDAGLHGPSVELLRHLNDLTPGYVGSSDDYLGMFGPTRHPGRFLFDTPDGLRLVDIGADIGDYFGVDGGVLVLNTPAGSELKPGDIVRRIEGADVASAAEAYRLLWGVSEDAEVEVRRKNRTITVAVPEQPRQGRASWRIGPGTGTVEVEVTRPDDAP